MQPRRPALVARHRMDDLSDDPCSDGPCATNPLEPVTPAKDDQHGADIDALSDAASALGSDAASSLSSGGDTDRDDLRVPDLDSQRALSQRGAGLAAFNAQRQVSSSSKADRLGLSGVARRGFLDFERKSKAAASFVQGQLGKCQAALGSISTAWNKGKLRRGDRLDPQHEVRRGSRGNVRPTHPRAWTLQGTVEMAFTRIGALCPDAKTLRESKRPTDAVAAVSLACTDHQRGASQAWRSSLSLGSGTCRWAFVGRSQDCTPIKVSFGALAPLSRVARYWHRQEKGCAAELIFAEELLQRKGKLPGHGIAELMAQSGSVAWPEVVASEFCAVHRKQLVFPPCFVSRTNASTLYAAMELADASLQLDALLKLTEAVDVVVLFLGSDLAGSCSRAKQEVARRVLEHNRQASQMHCSVVLLFDGHCVGHVLHREIEHCFCTRKLIPKLHACAFSCSLPANYSRILKSLRSIVEEDLRTNFFPGLAPPSEEWSHHTKVLGELTLLRCRYVRGQVEDGDYVNPALYQLHCDFVRLMNGNPKLKVVQHYCHQEGCCGNRDRATAVSDITDLLSACYFLSMGVCLPSASRWYTFSPHLARQCGSLFLHGLLPRVLARAWGDESESSSDSDDQDSFRAAAKKKRETTLQFVQDPTSAKLLGNALVACLPVDQLSYRLQHLDHAGGGVSELVDSSPAGLLISTQHKFWQYMNPWHARGSAFLETVWYFLDNGDLGQDEVMNDSRACCLSLSAAVWSRLELKCPG